MTKGTQNYANDLENKLIYLADHNLLTFSVKTFSAFGPRAKYSPQTDDP